MGDMADMMLDGTMCAGCGTLLNPEGGDGFPQYCSECGGDQEEDFYEAERRERISKKQHNKVCSTKLLQENKIPFTSKNKGVHLMVGNPIVADFWPSTGKYIFRNPRIEGRGVFNLMKELKKVKEYK